MICYEDGDGDDDDDDDWGAQEQPMGRRCLKYECRWYMACGSMAARLLVASCGARGPLSQAGKAPSSPQAHFTSKSSCPAPAASTPAHPPSTSSLSLFHLHANHVALAHSTTHSAVRQTPNEASTTTMVRVPHACLLAYPACQNIATACLPLLQQRTLTATCRPTLLPRSRSRSSRRHFLCS